MRTLYAITAACKDSRMAVNAAIWQSLAPELSWGAPAKAKMTKLNGWQRIGVLLSSLWVAFTFGYLASSWHEKPFFTVIQAEAPQTGVVGGQGEDIRPTSRPSKRRLLSDAELGIVPVVGYRFEPLPFLVVLLGPVFGGWSAAYVLIFIVRWVAAGFRRNPVPDAGPAGEVGGASRLGALSPSSDAHPPLESGCDVKALRQTIASTLFSFQGRINRRTFAVWWFASALVYFSALFILESMGISTRGALGYVMAPPLVWVNFALLIKRLHDREWSAWFLLALLIPIVGLWVCIEAFFLRGSPGRNRYGEAPA